MGNKAVRAYAIKTFAIDDTQFWAVRTPVACATWSLRGGSDYIIRSDPDDATTEDVVTAGTQEAATTSSTFIHQRYGSNEIVIWAKNAAAGSAVLVGKFFD